MKKLPLCKLPYDKMTLTKSTEVQAVIIEAWALAVQARNNEITIDDRLIAAKAYKAIYGRIEINGWVTAYNQELRFLSRSMRTQPTALFISGLSRTKDLEIYVSNISNTDRKNAQGAGIGEIPLRTGAIPGL